MEFDAMAEKSNPAWELDRVLGAMMDDATDWRPLFSALRAWVQDVERWRQSVERRLPQPQSPPRPRVRDANTEAIERAVAARDAATNEQPTDDVDDHKHGLYGKFIVKRTDRSSEPGGKHEHCSYFVLDTNHDKFAAPALRAYAQACGAEYPALAEDLWRMVGAADDDWARDESERCIHDASRPCSCESGLYCPARPGRKLDEWVDTGAALKPRVVAQVVADNACRCGGTWRPKGDGMACDRCDRYYRFRAKPQSSWVVAEEPTHTKPRRVRVGASMPMASGSSIEIAGLIDVPVGADAHAVCRAALVHELDAVLDVAACDLDKPYPLEDFTIDSHEPAATAPTSELIRLRERVQFLDAMSDSLEATLRADKELIEERDREIAGLRTSLLELLHCQRSAPAQRVVEALRALIIQTGSQTADCTENHVEIAGSSRALWRAIREAGYCSVGFAPSEVLP
jgi:hypothetical protein